MRVALDLARRALQLDLRDPAWVVGRGALAAALLLALVVATTASARVGAAGLTFFRGLVYLDFAFVAGLAVGPFSSALSEEKAGDTLGVLRLAGLSPSGVLAAKATGLLGSALLLLAVQLPFAMLGTTLGGVSRAQVAAAFVHLGCFMCAAQALALWLAARSVNPRAASFATGAVLGVWLFAPTVVAMFGGAMTTAGGTGGVAETLASWSPLHAALPRSTLPAPPLLTFSAWLCLCLAPPFYVLAARALGRASVVTEQPTRRPPVLVHTRAGRSVRRRPGRRTAALRWKEEHYVVGGPLGMRRRVWLYGALWLSLAPLCYDPRGDSLLAWGGTGLVTFLAIALVEAGWVSSILFRQEIQERTLFGLALLSLPPSTWAVAKASGALLAQRVPACYAAASFLLIVVAHPGALAVVPVAVGAWVLVGLLVVYGTLFMSLWLPRGAFLASLALVGVPAWMIATFGKELFAVFACFSYYVLPIAILGAVSSLQVAMGKRLRVLAAQ